MANTSKKLTKRTNSVNAELAYIQRRENVEEILRRIKTAMDAHNAAERNNSRDWGYVGDLGRVQEELAQVLAALGNLSAITELGLNY